MTTPELEAIAAAAREGALIATKEWLNVREAALCFGVSEWTIRHLLESGQIPYSKKLKRILIPRAELNKRLEKGMVRPEVEKQLKRTVDNVVRKHGSPEIDRIIKESKR